jgi:alkyldihydroxyacetonephosphate synthase
VVRASAGAFDHAPDVVARPRDERDGRGGARVVRRAGAACIPYGGGSSVVGGVTPAVDGPAVSLDLAALGGCSRSTRSRAPRASRPARSARARDQLAEHGLTLRHFPQSFEFSTLGGWVATARAGTSPRSRRTSTTSSRRCVRSARSACGSRGGCPARAPGPSPDRLLLGSEGILGVITEAWVRVRPRPTFKQAAGVTFGSFLEGAACVRALSQSGLRPANCRLIDATEAGYTGAGDGSRAVLVLGFESADHDVGAPMARAVAIAREHGGEVEERDDASGGAVGSWRGAFLRAPYLRDTFVAIGILSETFETAITWERFEGFHEQVLGAVREAAGERALVSCRFTHVYPDGPAPYYTVLAPARRGEEVEQWAEIKAAASGALIAGGRHDHAPPRGRPRPPPLVRPQPPRPVRRGLRGGEGRARTPAGILNPRVLPDP